MASGLGQPAAEAGAAQLHDGVAPCWGWSDTVTRPPGLELGDRVMHLLQPESEESPVGTFLSCLEEGSFPPMGCC